MCSWKLLTTQFCFGTLHSTMKCLLQVWPGTFSCEITNLWVCVTAPCRNQRYALDFFPRVLLISVPARTRVQFESGVNITQQRCILGVLACVRSATTPGPCCCQQWVQRSQPRSLLRHQLPPLQALQYTRPSSVLRCELRLSHLIIVGALFEGGLILFSSACTCSAGSIWGREEIEEIRYLDNQGL